MSRKSSRRRGRDYNYYESKNNYKIANRRLLLSKPVTTFPDSLRLYEDRRAWHPEGAHAPARGFRNTLHRLKIAEPTRSRTESVRRRIYRPFTQSTKGLWKNLRTAIAFVNPDKTIICVRRKIRREIAHALGFAGRGGGGSGKNRPPKYNEYSKIHC